MLRFNICIYKAVIIIQKCTCIYILGLKALSHVVKINSGYALEHQDVVIDCLEHPDATIQRKVGCRVFDLVNFKILVLCEFFQVYLLIYDKQWSAAKHIFPNGRRYLYFRH